MRCNQEADGRTIDLRGVSAESEGGVGENEKEPDPQEKGTSTFWFSCPWDDPGFVPG